MKDLLRVLATVILLALILWVLGVPLLLGLLVAVAEVIIWRWDIARASRQRVRAILNPGNVIL